MIDVECREELAFFLKPKNYSSFTFKGDTKLWKDLDPLDYIKLVACAVIIVGGLLGNVSIILSVALTRSLRTTINIYITNLAVTDATICIICMIPLAFKVTTSGDVYLLGKFMCKFNPFTQMTCLTCSVFTLSAISCDRFIAIVFPLHVRVTKQRPAVVIAVIWIISIIVSTPFLVVNRHEVKKWKNFLQPQCREIWPVNMYYHEAEQRCIKYESIRNIYYIVVSLVLFFFPILIMITAYSLILWRMCSSRVPGERHQSNVNIQSRTRKKVNKMIFVVLVAFILCWTPLQILVLYVVFGHNPQLHGELPRWITPFTWFSYYIAYANSFLNPLIYGGFNKNFREGFCMFLRCKYLRDRYKESVLSRLTTATGVKQSNLQTISRTSKTTNKSSLKSYIEMKQIPMVKGRDVCQDVKNNRCATEVHV